MTVSRPTALIVEDQPFVGMVTSDILEEAGFATFHAYDADEAAKLMDEHPEIALLVTEAELPGGVDGFELCRWVKQRTPHVQLIVTAETPDVWRSERSPDVRILRKPYASGELRLLIAWPSPLADA